MKKDNEWGFYTLPTQTDPEKRAIERLKIASELSLEHYGTPLVVTTSGGKDSSVCVELALRGGASRLKCSTTTQLRMRRRQCGLYGRSLPDLKIWA